MVLESESNVSAPPEWTAKYTFVKQTSITQKDIFLIGMTVVLSGQVRGWQGAMDAGFWTLLCSMLIPTVGYVILTFCIAEMTSALPFSGGIYGFVRAFTTPLLGFIVAVFEIVLNTFYVSPTVYSLASFPSKYGTMPKSLILLNCFVIYAIILSILLLGGKLFWILNTSFGVGLLVLVLIYILGSIPNADFDAWGKGSHENDFNMTQLMAHIPTVTTLFLGIQFLPLTSRCAQNPKKDIPVMMVIVIIVCIMSIIGLTVMASSQYPGIDLVALEEFPLAYGFSKICNISYEHAIWFCFPFLFASAFAFIFCCGRQSSCMAKSGLLPEIFQEVIPFLDTPYISLLIFALMNFVLNIIFFYNESLIQHCAIVTSLSTMIVCIAALISYICFHKKYSSLERLFISPLGTIGAYVGIVIFLFCFISSVGYASDNYISIFIIAVITVLSLIYFIFFSGEQIFSEEEKEELFKAYLVNANIATKKRIQNKKKNQKRSKVSPLTTVARLSITSRTRETDGNNEELETPEKSVGIVRPPLIVTITESEKQRELLQVDSTSSVGHNSTSFGAGSNPPTSSERVETIPHTKSLSEKIINYLSTKMNKIIPNPDDNLDLQHLQILQDGGNFINESLSLPLPITNIPLNQQEIQEDLV